MVCPRLPGLRPLLLGLLPLAALGSWAPQPLRDFAAGPGGPGAAAGVRRFRHEERRFLADGGAVGLRWEADADPAELLGLDWERQNGVSLAECRPDQLVLHVPKSYAEQSERWRHVAVSSSLHRCRHLHGKNLYHRVLRVVRMVALGQSEEHHAVTLATEELPSHAHVFRHCRFSLSLTPPLSVGPPAGGARRRLQSEGAAKYSWGYNWNYGAKMEEDPRLAMDIPGAGSGSIRLRKPHLQTNLAMHLNYSSDFAIDMKAPHVSIVGAVIGTVNFNLDLAVEMQLKGKREDTMLQQLLRELLPTNETSDPMTFFMGPVPVTVTPTFQCKLKVRQVGLLDGSFRLALGSDLQVNVTTIFDTEKPLKVYSAIKAKDVNFVPPTWMLQTDGYELDSMIDANVSLSPYMAIGIKPRLNFSVELMKSDSHDDTDANNCTPRPISYSFNASLALTGLEGAEVPSLAPTAGQGMLDELLPAEACVTGVCLGELPGCKKARSAAIRIKQIVFRMSRDFKWQSQAGPNLKQAVAYALSLLPELVEVLNGTEGSSEGMMEHLMTAFKDLSPRREVRHVEHKMEHVGQKMEHMNFSRLEGEMAGAVENLTEVAIGQALKSFAGGGSGGDPALGFLHPLPGRRLAGPRAARDSKTVVVRVVEPPHYAITGDLVYSLLRTGTLQIQDGREQTDGPIRVTGLRVVDAPQERRPQQLWTRGSLSAPAGPPVPMGVVFAAGAGMLLAGATSAALRRRHYTPAPTNPAPEAAGMH